LNASTGKWVKPTSTEYESNVTTQQLTKIPNNDDSYHISNLDKSKFIKVDEYYGFSTTPTENDAEAFYMLIDKEDNQYIYAEKTQGYVYYANNINNAPVITNKWGSITETDSETKFTVTKL
jgi:hypothetical protein